jgi:hypothetical protein
MKLKALSVFLLAAATASLSMACSADTTDDPSGDDDDVAESEAIAAKVTPGSFKLYMNPRAEPNPSCDVHTKLDLEAAYFSTARLSEGLAGFCEIAVIPNERTYRLRAAGNDCGSRIFTGSRKKDGKSYAIKITDHRTRLCENVVPAAIIVEETVPGFPGAITTTKYSHDGSPTGQEVTLEGTLTRSFGIGGENTGSSIATSSGLTELILDDGERNQFVAGKKARAKGVIKLLSGVETRNRKALDVKEMLVCPDPGYVNCMPGPNRRLSSLCSSENSTWVTANCAGVQFTY